MPESKQVRITGGCICGAIRYAFTLPETFDWPPTTNGTCQCTLCRKFTGSLFPRLLTVEYAWMEKPLSEFPTFKRYFSTETGSRGFCSECGCSLSFQFNNPRCELYMGTIDEEVLCGKKVGEEEGGEGTGMKAKREGGIGKELFDTSRSGHIWVENAIPGITDVQPGLKMWRDYEEGKGFEKVPGRHSE